MENGNEDETMTMTQPDLVSKLREVIAKLEKHGCYCDANAGWSCPIHGWLRELESLIGLEGQAAPSKWCAKYGGLYDGDYCGMCDCELKQPSPSTPIVPGTAGLSADNDCTGDQNCKHECPDVARIRKDVLEEAAQVADDAKVGPMNEASRAHYDHGDEDAANFNLGQADIAGDIAAAIRALAERPAPAGEVKGEKS